MQLKLNHYYMTRDGLTAGPLVPFDCVTRWKFRDPRFGYTYTAEGDHYVLQNSSFDLVKELGSAADGWQINNGIQPNIMGRVEAICRDGSLLNFPAACSALYWKISNAPSCILIYRPTPRPEPKRKRAERLAHAILLRMKEIDGDVKTYKDEVADCHDYGLLWDAILDEIKHICPDIDSDEVLDV